jgi:7-cyano-7-deazaguanine synthase
LSENPKAVVLLSGGLDSSTVAYLAKAEGYDLHCLTVHYGQKHYKELMAAERIAEAVEAKEHHILTIQLPWGGSALTDPSLQVPRDGVQEGVIPITYVPARNMILLSFATSYAEVIEARHILAGMNAIDYSGYPDCRPEFINAFSRAIFFGTKAIDGERMPYLRAPLMEMNKQEIIELGLRHGVPYELTWSCYTGGDEPCHECDSCRLREEAWKAIGKEDPLCQKT